MSANSSDVIARLLRGGTEHVVSHHGRSQYSAGGSGMSSCGLAALNCALVVLQRELEGASNEDILKDMLKRSFVEEILDICLQWSGSAHLDVNEISAAPVFAQGLSLTWSDYTSPDFQQFQVLLHRLQQTTRGSAAMLLTRPPEIVCVLKIANNSKPLFVTFDSHPRPKHPNGAAFIFHPSLDAAASYLNKLLKFDRNLLSDPNLQWQAQLLGHCSAHTFLAREMPKTSGELSQSLLKASLEILQLKAEFEDLQFQTGEVSRLQAEVDTMQTRNRVLDADKRRLVTENAALKRRIQSLEDSNRYSVRPNSTVAPASKSSPYQRIIPPKNAGPSTASTSRTLFSSPLAQSSTKSQQPKQKGAMVFRTRDEVDDDNAVFATFIELEWRSQTEDDAALEFARREQEKLDEENRQLEAQLEELKVSVPKTFECGICFEEEPESMVTQIERCSHKFCRNCIRSYLHSKLGEHRFPILCPTCSADRSVEDPGAINSAMAQIIGLSEEDYGLFTELELAAFSVPLYCRKCQQTVSVDKDEYNAQKTIACPLRGCNHVWCKACSREIEIGGPQHSCDGSSELNHLMNERGWRKCPGCQTPVMKAEGCHHMTCIAPACNTHFCYRCGDTIVRSSLRGEIRNALSSHYARCQMIEIPP